jgi:hypothetical protein
MELLSRNRALCGGSYSASSRIRWIALRRATIMIAEKGAAMIKGAARQRLAA